MKGIKKGLAGLIVLLNFHAMAQLGFGVRAGFQQSVPLVMRDSFSGKPSLSGALTFYHPLKSNVQIAAGLAYRQVDIEHKIETSTLSWHTLGLNIGTEWTNLKLYKTKFYTGFNATYVFAHGESVLSGGTSSGRLYKSLPIKEKIVPSIELGLTFNPRPYLNFTLSTIQPVIQTVNQGNPTLPGTLSFGIEYRITTRDIKNWKLDTTPLAEKSFASNLRAGTLYFIETGTDSSQKLFRKMIAEHYNYSKVQFIKDSNLRDSLQAFSHSANAHKIFIAKTGSIIYNMERASTHGLIVYNHTMQNPMPDDPFFVRNLAGDAYFEDPLVVKKLIKTLNKRLYKLHAMYR